MVKRKEHIKLITLGNMELVILIYGNNILKKMYFFLRKYAMAILISSYKYEENLDYILVFYFSYMYFYFAKKNLFIYDMIMKFIVFNSVQGVLAGYIICNSVFMFLWHLYLQFNEDTRAYDSMKFLFTKGHKCTQVWKIRLHKNI